jgi:hypothetical protein
MGEVGALETSLFYPAKCDVLWLNRTFHSFPNVWNWNEVQCFTSHVRVIILK